MDLAFVTSLSLISSADSSEAISVKDFIGFYYDYLSFNMDAEVVTQLMLSQQLLNGDVVLAASSDYQKNCLILEKVRAMSLQTLQSFVELLLTNDSQKHIGIMLTDGLRKSFMMKSTDSGVYQHDPISESILISTKMDPSSVVMEFLNTKLQLEKVLQHCDLLPPMVKKCGSLLASEIYNVPLFSTVYAERLQKIKDIAELIHALSPFMTWDNHSVLSSIAEISGIPEATVLLTQFDDRIDSSQPLKSFPIPAPSHLMVPCDNSTQNLLAVKLELELHRCTLQNVIDTHSLILSQCKLTPYCLQLLAVAKSNLTILYWMIPKNVAHLITASALQFQNYYHQHGILELAVYPGAVIFTRGVLKVGPLSFFSQIEIDSNLLNNDERDRLTIELSQLEELPRVMCKLQVERKKKAINIKMLKRRTAQKDEEAQILCNQVSVANDGLTIEPQSSFQAHTMGVLEDREQLMIQLMKNKESEEFLKRKIVKEKQKYSNLLGIHEELKQSKGLGEKILKEKQKYSDLLGKYEQLQSSLVLGSGVQTELTRLQTTMESVNISLEKVEAIKNYWGDKSTRTFELQSRNQNEETTDELPLVGKLKKLNSNLATIEEWSAVIQLLQTELSDRTERIDQLQSQKKKLETNLQSIQEKEKIKLYQLADELSEKNSQLMVKSKELTKLKMDYKLLEKHSSKRKNMDNETIQQLTEKNQIYQRQLETYKSTIVEETEELKSTIEELQRDIQQLTEEKCDYQTRMKVITEENKLLHQELMQKNELAIVSEKDHSFTLAPLDETQLYVVMKQNGVVVKWRELGVQLLNTKDIHYLDEIKANHPQNVRGCCYEMFEEWLRTRLDASWDQLCNALVTIDLPVAAKEIKQELSRDASKHYGSANTASYTIEYCYLVLDIVARWQAEKKDLRSARTLILRYCSKEAINACDKNQYASFYLAVVYRKISINLLEAIANEIPSDTVKQRILQYKTSTEANQAACCATQNHISAFCIELCDIFKNDQIPGDFILFIVIVIVVTGLCLHMF